MAQCARWVLCVRKFMVGLPGHSRWTRADEQGNSCFVWRIPRVLSDGTADIAVAVVHFLGGQCAGHIDRHGWRRDWSAG